MLKTVSLVITDKKYQEKFLYAFSMIVIIAAFAMNFLSLPGLLQGRILVTEIVSYDSLIFLFVFSLLAAAAITLHIYKSDTFKQTKLGKGKIGIVGGFLGLFTSACTICYPLILTALGIPTALLILPFGGLEVQALSIALLLLSIYFITKNIENCEKCKTK